MLLYILQAQDEEVGALWIGACKSSHILHMGSHKMPIQILGYKPSTFCEAAS